MASAPNRESLPVGLLPQPADDPHFLSGLIQGMRCGVLAIDPEGRLHLLNEPGRQILELDEMPPRGVTVEQALGRHPQLARVLRESFEMSSLPNRAEIELEGTAAGRKTIGFTISLIRDDDDLPCGAAFFFKDLTRIEHKEEQERLRDRLAALGQMAASMAHEIRNPLAAIEVSCSLLKRRLPPDGGGVELLEKITAEVHRLNSTVNSSLEFVRPICPSLGTAELAPMLEEAITVAVERLARRGVHIRRRFCDSMPAFQMDRALLRQVFVNLILNGIEAVGQEGTVTISTEVVEASRETSVPYQPGEIRPHDPWQNFEHFALIRVSDSGPGIEEEALSRIFYPFFTTKKEGSGVGLSTAKKIVDSHRGLIDVDNRPGAGAVFTVRLPMVLQRPEV